MSTRPLLLLPLLTIGCELLDDTGLGNTDAWTVRPHPCAENRTDALWLDDANTLFVGCGTGVDGTGLYRSTDGGVTWDLPDSTGDVFASMRVNSISRAPDGLLYIAGTAPGGVRVVSWDGTTAESFYTTPADRPQVWQTFQVGTFRMNADGEAVSESLTGSDVLYWSSDASEPVDAGGWWTDAGIPGGAQILDLEVWDGRFYGSGSTINQPPYFFYQSGSEGLAFQAIQLSPDGLGSFTGEGWDVDVDEQGNAIVGGVNQDSNVATLWWSEGDLTVASSWRQYDVSELVADGTSSATRFYGSCRSGDVMVGVGDYSQRDDAFGVVSTDGGSSWREMVAPMLDGRTAGPLTRCVLMDDALYVAGAGGLYAFIDVADL